MLLEEILGLFLGLVYTFYQEIDWTGDRLSRYLGTILNQGPDNQRRISNNILGNPISIIFLLLNPQQLLRKLLRHKIITVPNPINQAQKSNQRVRLINITILKYSLLNAWIVKK